MRQIAPSPNGNAEQMFDEYIIRVTHRIFIEKFYEM
jgi:hypothetical protein